MGFGVALRCSSYRACYALRLPLLPSPAPFILLNFYARHYSSSYIVVLFPLSSCIAAILLSLSCCESPRQVIARSSQSGALLSCSCSRPSMRPSRSSFIDQATCRQNEATYVPDQPEGGACHHRYNVFEYCENRRGSLLYSRLHSWLALSQFFYTDQRRSGLQLSARYLSKV